MNVNTAYLTDYISRRLHTIVRTWNHPYETDPAPDVFCCRQDLNDPYLNLYHLYGMLHEYRATSSYPTLPVIFSLNKNIFYAFVPTEGKDFLIGPVTFAASLRVNLNTDNISVEEQDAAAVPVCDFSDFSSDILLVYNLFRPSFITLDDLVTACCTDESMETDIMQDYSSLVFDRQEQEVPHNPYDQEVREFTAIEQGDLEMLKKSWKEDYIGKIGVLAKDEIRHARNLGIVVVTLASRAAIRGGLLPEVSFSMSDVFIRKFEEVSDPVMLTNLMHQFEYRYTEMVAELKQQKKGSRRKDQNPRIDACKDYIFKHLHEKIRVQDIAEQLYLNANYLSEIFKNHEGITITEFILREKVNLTKNLLTYSPYSYIEIATYLGFSSQSHLGKVFKKWTGMTLRQYRDQYGV